MTQKYILLETTKALKEGLFNNLNEMVKEAQLVIKDFQNTEVTSDLKESLNFMKRLSQNKYKSFQSVQKAAKKVLNNYTH